MIPTDTAKPGPGLRRAGQVVAWLSGLYLAVMLLLWGVLYWASDRWWLATAVMFGPRWIWGLPLVLLIPASAWARRGALWALAACLGILIGPVMGLCASWRGLLGGERAAGSVRILSLNAHWKSLNTSALRELIGEVHPDLVAIQGWPDGKRDAVFAGSWHVHDAGQYCLGARLPILQSEPLVKPEPCKGTMVRYLVDTPIGNVNVFNVHLTTPRSGLSAVIGSWWHGAKELQKNSDRRRLEAEAGSGWALRFPGPVLLAGDFNTPIESTIYSEFWSRFGNAYSEAGLGFGRTFFTTRAGVRIDHILLGPGWRCLSCSVGPDVGSEHRPLIADLEWMGEQGE